MIGFSIVEEKLICNFPERMDTENCNKCAEDLYEKVHSENKPVVFNLEKVNYVSSMFLSVCIEIFKQIGKGNFSLVNVQPNVKKVFKIAGLETLLAIK